MDYDFIGPVESSFDFENIQSLTKFDLNDIAVHDSDDTVFVNSCTDSLQFCFG